MAGSTIGKVPGGRGSAWLVARLGAATALIFALASCALLEPRAVTGAGPYSATSTRAEQPPESADSRRSFRFEEASEASAAPRERRDEIVRGTGRFIDADAASRAVLVEESTGNVSLNFEAADLREVTAFVLGELLQLNYVIHEGVRGQATLQTSRPIEREALLPTLEQILRLHGVVVVPVDGVYQIMPRDGALQGTVAPRVDLGQPGFGVRIVPLRYIAAAEMEKILQPFLVPGAVLRVDRNRNLLILAGTRREMVQWLETIEIFDVDWLKGMSVGMFTLKHTDVVDVAEALQQILADPESPVFGMFRLVPVARLNMLMVVTPQAAYLDEARIWINRLDRGADTQTPRLYVYRMQNAAAADIADVLNQVYGSGTTRSAAPALAPGLEPVEVGASGGREAGTAGGRRGGAVAATVLGPGADGLGAALTDEVRVVADDRNNALLVLASPRDYDVIEAAVRQLDIPPMQVLVDATIIEVALTDELRYGLQWFFKNRVGDYAGQGRFTTGDSAVLAPTFPGFNYSILDSAGMVRAVLSALAEDSRVNVLSSPSVMVLDNQSATIRVGDQIPIRTSESQGTTEDARIVSTIQYRETGVLLKVTPRVTSGGMVVMEVRQEVDGVTRTTTSGIDSPTIQQRLVESSVAVQSGETVVLGGLIREVENFDSFGLPVLYRLPVVGPLFGTTSKSVQRVELLVLITPQVARDVSEAREVTEEFRRRMSGLGERAFHRSPGDPEVRGAAAE